MEIDKSKLLFDGKQLRRLIFPLIIEQFLNTFVGMTDTIMVSTVGESAVSAVSLVDTINVLLINIFAALATGGAVVAGQFLGCHDKEHARKASDQLVLFGAITSLGVMGLIFIFRSFILHVVFGKIAPEVMGAASTYLLIVNFSIPFIALYSCGAALFRSMGNSKITMLVSLLMNGINVGGNALCIFGFKMGVEGVAIPTLVSRIVAAIVILKLLRNEDMDIYTSKYFTVKWDFPVIRQILRIGIPNGVENSMFQLGKIILLSLVSTFGTASIAANAVSNTVAAFEILPGMAIGLALVTVVSHCIGAGDVKQARYYTKKLVFYAVICMLVLNVTVTLLLPQILSVYKLSDETFRMAKEIITYHGILAILIWPLSFTLPNALRAANDVDYTMVVGMCSMWLVRIGAGYLIAKNFGFGVLGVWIAMFLDWIVRTIFFLIRFAGSKWAMKKK